MPTVEDVVRALHAVIDPEIGLDVVELGLVYGIDLEPGAVHVRLAMTSPTCPLSEYLLDAARRAIARLPAVDRVLVSIADEPAWAPEMMSDEARRRLA
jgi:metal-sulfur cluster biosynthetic enzyme